jgi:hypothetical protein
MTSSRCEVARQPGPTLRSWDAPQVDSRQSPARTGRPGRASACGGCGGRIAAQSARLGVSSGPRLPVPYCRSTRHDRRCRQLQHIQQYPPDRGIPLPITPPGTAFWGQCADRMRGFLAALVVSPFRATTQRENARMREVFRFCARECALRRKRDRSGADGKAGTPGVSKGRASRQPQVTWQRPNLTARRKPSRCMTSLSRWRLAARLKVPIPSGNRPNRRPSGPSLRVDVTDLSFDRSVLAGLGDLRNAGCHRILIDIRAG